MGVRSPGTGVPRRTVSHAPARDAMSATRSPTPAGDLHPPKGVLVYASEAVAGYNSPAAMVHLKSTLNKDLMLSEPPNASTVMRASTDQ